MANNDYEKYGLYLNCKTQICQNEIFNYNNSKDTNQINYFFEGHAYVTELKYQRKIECSIYQSNCDQDNGKILFKLCINNKEKDEKKRFEINKINDKSPYDINQESKAHNPKINQNIWYIINSDDKYVPNMKEIKNDDYYLEENDIIKIGPYKYVISKIHIKDRTLNKKGKFINLEPNCKEISKCEFCEEPVIKLCNCPESYHIYEISKKFDNNKPRLNSKKTVRNYYFNICYCDKCKMFYSLKYKCKTNDLDNIDLEKINIENNSESQNDEKILSFFNYEIPQNKDYMILESIEEKLDDLNNVKKSVHIIELNEDQDIKIGRAVDNDIILFDDKRISHYHAIIKYDKKNGKLKILNLSKYSGTLALIYPKNKKIIQFTEKPLFFQVSQTFFEAKIITKNDFIRNKQNNCSQYPCVYKEDKNKENKK